VATLCRSITAVELSEIAVAKARARHPQLEFLRGDVRRLEALSLPDHHFDLIVASDVIAYLTPREADRLLLRIRRLLKPEGKFFLAAWSPGGRYFTPEALERLASRHFALLLRRLLPSGHAAFLGRPRFRDLVLTFDYETWQPVPEGKRIDWVETVLEPAEKLMRTAEKHRVPLTFFVEMGELLTLRRLDPPSPRSSRSRSATRAGAATTFSSTSTRSGCPNPRRVSIGKRGRDGGTRRRAASTGLPRSRARSSRGSRRSWSKSSATSIPPIACGLPRGEIPNPAARRDLRGAATIRHPGGFQRLARGLLLRAPLRFSGRLVVRGSLLPISPGNHAAGPPCRGGDPGVFRSSPSTGSASRWTGRMPRI
jgi:hypothetical protein